VAGIAPEAGVQHLAPVGRVALELHELPVPAGLKGEADDPHDHAQRVDDRQCGGGGAPLGGQQRSRDDPQDHALKQVDAEEAQPPPARAAFLTPFGVAEVFPLAPVAVANVQRQTQAPDGDERQEEQLAWREAVRRQDVVGQGDDDEPEAPEAIDDARVFDGQADQPQDGHQDHAGQQTGEVHLKEGHGGLLPPG